MVGRVTTHKLANTKNDFFFFGELLVKYLPAYVTENIFGIETNLYSIFLQLVKIVIYYVSGTESKLPTKLFSLFGVFYKDHPFSLFCKEKNKGKELHLGVIT